MNRSFRAPEAPMLRGTRSLGAVIKEKDEELALFLEMRRREKERSDSLLLDASDDLDRPPGSKPGSSPIFKIASTGAPVRKTGLDDFLNSEGEKNDYDWLLTPPGTPLFPSLDKEPSRSPVSLDGTPKSRPTALKSRLAAPSNNLSWGNSLSKLSANSGSNPCNVGIRRPSSSGGSGSVSGKLPGGPSSVSSRLSGGSGSVSSRLCGGLSSSSRPLAGSSLGPGSASRPSSRPSTPTSRPTIPAASKSSRPSTPTSRATLPVKPAAPRSATPSRSSTPTSRPSLAPPPSKPSSRASTPTRRPSTPSNMPNNYNSGPTRTTTIKQAAAVSKAQVVPPRSSSPSARPRTWKPSDMPGFSLEAPPNLRTSLPDRPTSATRGRPGAPSSRSSSIEPGPTRPRRQSCSPSRGRAPNGSGVPSGSSVPAVSRSRTNSGEQVSAVLIGSKMVERVVNARRLAPPRQDSSLRSSHNSSGKLTSSPDGSGFGRSLSKKSLDMALRHMDIRQTIPSNLRPLMTNVPASSMYSVRSGPAKSRAFSASDSPLATSSNCSSEQSVNNTNFFLEGSEIGDEEIRIER